MRVDDCDAIRATERIRVLLVDLATMPRQLIERELALEPDIQVVKTPDNSALEHAVTETGADAVVLGSDDPRLVEGLLADQPRLKLLAVVGDARDLLLFELRPHREELGELTKEKLIRALRSVRTHRIARASRSKRTP